MDLNSYLALLTYSLSSIGAVVLFGFVDSIAFTFDLR